MVITEYTSYDEIRQACGLSIKELTDAELGVELYRNALQLKLREVTLPAADPGPGPLDTRFLTIKAQTEGDRTLPSQKLYNLTRLFATYVVAYEVSMSLSMRAPKQVADGKRTLVRFSPESTYEISAANIKKQVEDLRQQIEAISSGSIIEMPFMTVVKPIPDVVTNT